MTLKPANPVTRQRAFEIIQQKSFVRGKVILASGQESDHYFDMKPSMLDPEGSGLLCQLILEQLSGMPVDGVGGLEMGAVPLIAPLAMVSWQQGRPIPGFFVRKAAKGHGTQRLIEGIRDVKGKQLVVVEDVTTTGGSAIKSIAILQEAGATVTLVLSILDRNQGATAAFKAAGLPFHSLFTAQEFLIAVTE
jgi:orotate phosphoribosyltransferase